MKLEEIGHPALVWISCFSLDLLSWRYEETGAWIENKKLPHWITWLLLCLPLPYFFNNKRHRHCFFILSSAEKEAAPFWNSPIMVLFICIFQNSTSPSAILSLLYSRSCWLFFHSLVLAFSGQLGLYECHLFYARFAAASKIILAREWLCTFTVLAVKKDKERSLTPSKGWDFTLNTHG